MADRNPHERRGEKAADRNPHERRVKKAAYRNPWPQEEMDAVHMQLGKFVRLGKVPGKIDCLNAIQKECSLRCRNWDKVKSCVKNIIDRNKRKLGK